MIIRPVIGATYPLTITAQPLETVELQQISVPESSVSHDETNLSSETDEPAEHLQVKRLRQAKKIYEKLSRELWPTLSCKNVLPLKITHEHNQIPLIRQLLLLQGDLNENEIQDLHDPCFDTALKRGIQEFQRRHFLEDDGIIGERTYRALNLSCKQRLKRINLNLKRWKELLPKLPNTYILINIPTYYLYGVRHQEIEISQPVIVGMPSRQTPLMNCYLRNVILNPYWGVPHRIFVKDKLKKVLQDPDYLNQHGYIVSDGDGNPLDVTQINWSSVSEYYFPYRVTQLPGTLNALGNIKFTLDNAQAISMHSTPTPELFKRAARAFSSGCIRLLDPILLAAWSLKSTRYHSPQKIVEKIKDTATATLPLPQPLPVYFSYFSVWVDDVGRVLFSDPYTLDRGR